MCGNAEEELNAGCYCPHLRGHTAFSGGTHVTYVRRTCVSTVLEYGTANKKHLLCKKRLLRVRRKHYCDDANMAHRLLSLGFSVALATEHDFVIQDSSRPEESRP